MFCCLSSKDVASPYSRLALQPTPTVTDGNTETAILIVTPAVTATDTLALTVTFTVTFTVTSAVTVTVKESDIVTATIEILFLIPDPEVKQQLKFQIEPHVAARDTVLEVYPEITYRCIRNY